MHSRGEKEARDLQKTHLQPEDQELAAPAVVLETLKFLQSLGCSQCFNDGLKLYSYIIYTTAWIFIWNHSFYAFIYNFMLQFYGCNRME